MAQIAISDALALAIGHHQAGRLQAAEQIYRQILQTDPNHADALHLLGLIASQVGQHEIAIDCIGRAIGLNGKVAAFHHNLGGAYGALGRLPEAVACYRRALELEPGFAETHNNLGNALKDQGKLDDAIACYHRAGALKPDFAEAHNNLGAALKVQGKLDDALACYRRALELKPNYPEAHYNLGHALNELGHLDDAVACYRRALELRPDYAEAHNNLGIALWDQRKLDDAAECYRRALALKPDYAEAHSNLGNVFKDQGNLDDAIACYGRALELMPDHAEAHWNRALIWLACGDFARGWPEYEWRAKIARFAPRPFPQPRWDGAALDGQRILLYAEQGLGDTVQFVRYSRLVKQRGGHVIVECQPELKSLLTSCEGIDEIIARPAPLPDFDFQLPLLSLPGILGTKLDTIVADIPYLRADPRLMEHWRAELKPMRGFKVGIAWQGNPTFRDDQQRSIPLTHFASLAAISGVHFVSLQKGPGVDQLGGLAERFSVRDFGNLLDEASGPFMDTAAMMKNLDLVITSDTVIAHLAGALGVPVWLALPLVPDWRWLLEREDTPWYPTMRLFRQTRQGDWDEVFERMGAALRGISTR